MSNVTITIKNYDQVTALFKAAPARMTQEIHNAVSRSILQIERNVKREAPVNKRGGGGNLRQSIRSQMLGVAKGMVEVGAEYGAFVEFGTRPHVIRVKHKKVLANRRENKIFGEVVHHPGTRANPFFTRGISASERAVNKEFEKAVKNVLD
jgi:HK97 gp10 family phage protein